MRDRPEEREVLLRGEGVSSSCLFGRLRAVETVADEYGTGEYSSSHFEGLRHLYCPTNLPPVS